MKTQISAFANTKLQGQNTARHRTSTVAHHSTGALILQPVLWKAASSPNHHLLRSSLQISPRTSQRADRTPRSPYHQAEQSSHCAYRGLQVLSVYTGHEHEL